MVSRLPRERLVSKCWSKQSSALRHGKLEGGGGERDLSTDSESGQESHSWQRPSSRASDAGHAGQLAHSFRRLSRPRKDTPSTKFRDEHGMRFLKNTVYT